MGFAFELQALGVVNQPVEEGIGQGGVWDAQVPLGDRQLAGVGGIFVPLRDNLAIVLSEWTRFGELPELVWGQVARR